jgi:hypothetical protein
LLFCFFCVIDCNLVTVHAILLLLLLLLSTVIIQIQYRFLAVRTVQVF